MDKKVKNSLLSAASTGFSFDDFSDARIVPVAVQQEILKNTPEATAEIDLSDDGSSETVKPFLVPTSTTEVTSNLQSLSLFSPEPSQVVRDSTFIPFFKKSEADQQKDSGPSILPVSLTSAPPTIPSVIDLSRPPLQSVLPRSTPSPVGATIFPPPPTSTATTNKPKSILETESSVSASVSLFPVSSSTSPQGTDPFSITSAAVTSPSASSSSILSSFDSVSLPPIQPLVASSFNLNPTKSDSSRPTTPQQQQQPQLTTTTTTTLHYNNIATTTNTFNVLNPLLGGGGGGVATTSSIASIETSVAYSSTPSILSPSAVSAVSTISSTSATVTSSFSSDTTPTTSSTASTTSSFSNSASVTSSQTQDVGASSIGNVQTQGLSSNKYRIGGTRRLQYAQYPGLNVANANAPSIPSVPMPMGSMGNLTSQQPLPPPSAAAALQPLTGSLSSGVSSPVSPSYPPQQEYGTGYVFGEPPPIRSIGTSPNSVQYEPVQFHWFYHKEVEGKGIWKPFSFLDSVALEEAFASGSTEKVHTDGGRYDTNVSTRIRTPVYWDEDLEPPSTVRRCSWFYKGPLDNRFIPYEEDFAQQMEEEFKSAMTTGVWQRRVELGGGEAVIIHNANVIVHFCQAASPDDWGNLPENQLRPRVVKRGVDKSFPIEDGESTQIDHLVFVVHGIGAICDFKFRNIVEAVDDFRSLSQQLLHTHFRDSLEKGLIGRIEFLPVYWHRAIHKRDGKGVDERIKLLTLPSIPKLRHFTNDTLLDILFYTSPVYCQKIVDTVGSEINEMYDKFMGRNLDYDGSVSLGGHSLGSLILFDLLTHQPANLVAPKTDDPSISEQAASPNESTDQAGDAQSTSGGSSKEVLKSYTIGPAGTGQPSIVYPVFNFHPSCFFAMGSPTGVFVTVRGIDQLGHNFHFPTCPTFFNIFHPYDPVAYRIEPLIDPSFSHPPVVIPHHKGRKRFHLEIKDAMFRMGTDLKATMMDTLKNTWKTVYNLASFGKNEDFKLEQEIDRALEGELSKSTNASNQQLYQEHLPDEEKITIGQLNGGRRIDHVLQEAPMEAFNEYLFALSSHVCYWESEDTMLLIMREIYQSIGVFVDNHPAVPNGQTPAGITPGMEQYSSAMDLHQQQQQHQQNITGVSQYTSNPSSFYSSPPTESAPPMYSAPANVGSTNTNPYSSFAPPSLNQPLHMVEPAVRPNYRHAHPTSLSHPVMQPSSSFMPKTDTTGLPPPPLPQQQQQQPQTYAGPPPLSGFVRKS